ncbi:hypothetical protein Ae201684P_004472 [Aphanomyces euteiches]|uniref:CCHC-type domain-containing protein n=1 Tax=Aphanomyces euteiches TaxID=100861 RepID=A0A6G0WKG1_9STRA|nr:hypothetical protein Ae201684_014341 [Aphanomyces euteiches]KAH9068771.1 hypothetical protein Ae201684P_004472 [Aphanomyces euteiches]
MSATTTSIKLNNRNFRDWRTYLKERLMTKGLYGTLSPQENNPISDEDNQKAYGILIETLETEQYRHIDGIAAVDLAFKALQTYHEPITKADRIEILKEWSQIEWNCKRENLPNFIHRFEVLARRLRDVGVTESDENLVAKLLALMPWSFRHIVDRLLHTADQSLSTVKVALEAEWKAALRNGAMSKNDEMFNNERALTADGGRRGGRGRGHGRGRGQTHGRGANQATKNNSTAKKGTCHYCGKEGHWKSECRKKMADQAEKPQERSNQATDEDFMFTADDTTDCGSENYQNCDDQDGKMEFTFSAYDTNYESEDGHVLEDANPDPPAQHADISIENTEPADPKPFWSDVQWGPADYRPARTINVRGVETTVTFMSKEDILIAIHMLDPDGTQIRPLPAFLTSRYLVTCYAPRAYKEPCVTTSVYGAWANDGDNPMTMHEWLEKDAYFSYIHEVEGSTTRLADELLSLQTIHMQVAHDFGQLHFAMSIFEGPTHTIIVDSGASSHMTGNEAYLQDKKPCNRRVVVADGKSVVARSYGTMKFKTSLGTNISLIHVLFVEGMPTTLLSIPALM